MIIKAKINVLDFILPKGRLLCLYSFISGKLRCSSPVLGSETLKKIFKQCKYNHGHCLLGVHHLLGIQKQTHYYTIFFSGLSPEICS